MQISKQQGTLNIHWKGQQIKQIEIFEYLILTTDSKVDKEINNKIRKANQVY